MAAGYHQQEAAHGTALDRVLDALRAHGCAPRRSGAEWVARCPAHDDRTPSLGIAEGAGGRALLTCRAGCATAGVVAGLGLTLRDLAGESRERTRTARPRREDAPPPELVDIGPPTDEQVMACLDDLRVSRRETLGAVGARHVRVWNADWIAIPAMAGAKLWGIDADGTIRRDARGLVRRMHGPVSVIVSPDLCAARRNGHAPTRIYDVEGESDWLAAVDAGMAGVIAGTGGAGSLAGHDRHRAQLLALAAGAEVVVVRDLDDAGRRGARTAAEWWLRHGVPVRVVELPAELGEHGDLRDYLLGRPDCEPMGGPADLDALADAAPRQEPSAPRVHVDDDRSASETEDLANAQRLAQHHGRELRWSPGRGWLAYTGTVWEESETRALAIASRLGRIIQREAAERAEQAAKAESEVDRERLAKQAEALLRWARASEQAKRIRAALDLARPMLEIGEEALDADPYALACHNGVVDLRTGTLRPHRPEDYVTRCTGVAYDPEAHSELWDRVLAEALPEEPVRDYLRRCAGYTALGLTGEDVLLLVHGPTRTSKGTIQGAIAAALGSYAMTAGLETFAARRHADGARARPELIRLRGARMVSVYETGRALRLDAPLVKSLAGSDAITARALYREEVEFRPACTLWLATNHRPLVDDDDDALWERMREIPFRVQVTPERRDPTVRARLADPTDCGPAVLAWIVRGALDYQREGLAQPEAVRSATGDYRASMDPLGEYLGECAVLDARAWVAAGALREDYERWCRERGAKPLAASRWGDALRRHGAEREKVGETRGWRGIGLRSTARERET